MAPVRPLSFIFCLVVAATHALTPQPRNRTDLSGYVLKDEKQQLTQGDVRATEKKKDCEVVNTTESPLGLQEVQKVREEALTFYVRPKPSFKRLVFRMRLLSILKMSDEFYSGEAIDVDSSDLERSEEEPWTAIEVKHYQHKSRGPDSHALSVTVGNTTLSLVTHYWMLNRYQGFVVYVEGGAEVLFNCSPRDLHVPPSLKFNGVWLMAGLLITAALLLALLFSVWVSIQCRKKREVAPPLPQYPVYEEFDEEVLYNIRKKVEALRSCKSQDNLNNTGAVCYDAHEGNAYVVDMTLLKQSAPAATVGEEASPDEHVYQNVYSLRPTPAPRRANMEKTPEAEVLYQNLSSFTNSPEEVVDEEQSAEENLADDTGLEALSESIFPLELSWRRY